MKYVKVGIIGAGGIARDRHIPLLQAHDQATVEALYDVNRDLAQRVAQDFEIPHVPEQLEDLFERVDAVVICTPNQFHAELTIAALNAGVHVLCEKPMAMSTQECDAMIDAAKANQKVLTIAYHYRFTDVAMAAKKALQDGVVGAPIVTRIQAMRRRKVPGWGVFTNKTLQGGGCLIDYGCHVLDLAFWLLGDAQPQDVLGRTYNKLSKQPHQINEWGDIDPETFDVEDHSTSYLTFENGASMQFECSWSANINNDKLEMSISGEDGGIQLFPFERYEPKDGVYHIHESAVTLNEEVAAQRQTDHFVKCCLGLETPVVKPEEARRVNQVIEAIYQSSTQNKSITINS